MCCIECLTLSLYQYRRYFTTTTMTAPDTVLMPRPERRLWVAGLNLARACQAGARRSRHGTAPPCHVQRRHSSSERSAERAVAPWTCGRPRQSPTPLVRARPQGPPRPTLERALRSGDFLVFGAPTREPRAERETLRSSVSWTGSAARGSPSRATERTKGPADQPRSEATIERGVTCSKIASAPNVPPRAAAPITAMRMPA